MDDVRVGRICRALRHRRGWRQLDVASKAGCHQTTISRIERGHLGRLSIAQVRTVFAVLDARFEADVSWRGGALERLLDAWHAALVEAAARVYRDAGWETHIEVTYSEFGERGSIDLLTVDPARRVAAVNEIKTVIGSIEETYRKHDAKTRLATRVVEERLGWRPIVVSRVLVMPEDRTLRRLVERHGTLFDATYPLGTRAIQRWIRDPRGALAGRWFLPVKHEGAVRRRRARVRRPE